LGGETFDLFGNPVRDRKGQRGRPAFEVTERNRNKVKLLLAMGWQAQRIANAIEVSLATLKRHFRAELKVRDQMRDRLEAERLMVMAEQTAKGNVGAHRELARLIERNDRMETERTLGEQRKKPVSMGKKEVDRALARDADAQLTEELDREAQADVRH
jgi:hypothetical protein